MAENKSPKIVIVLGGSYAGISISHYLLKHILSDPSHHLTLVSASAQFFHRPSSVRGVISEKLIPSDKIFYNITDLFKSYGKDKFSFLHATATAMDPSSRTVTVMKPDGQTESLSYYALVIATGTRATSPLLSLHTDDTLIKSSWAKFREALPNAKSIIVAGGGPAGVETAGELGQYLNDRAGLFSSKHEKPKVPITIITNEAKILPLLRPAIAAKAEKYLAKVGVSVIKNAKVESVSPAGAGEEEPSLNNIVAKATVTLSNGETKEADLYIPATGVKPNTDFIPKDLLTEKGYLDVNGTTLRCEKAGERVYALGDVGSYTRGGIMDIYNTVPILATNIKRDLAHPSISATNREASKSAPKGRDRPYKPNLKETQLVPIGQSKGVGAVFGWKLPSFAVWLIKGRAYFTGSITEDVIFGKKWEKESKWKSDA